MTNNQNVMMEDYIHANFKQKTIKSQKELEETFN